MWARKGASMRNRTPFVLFTALSLSVALATAPVAAASDYLIMPGDVLQIDVTGMSGMQHSMPVGLDGTIRVPLAGPLLVAGHNIHDIGSLVQARLASKTLRQTTSAGEEFLVIIDPEQVLVSIAEYRPVYLSGDVASPGAQAYRPGMTVRQAISLAGGTGIGERTQTDMFLQTADYRADRASLWTEFARETLRITRIRSELAGADTVPDFTVEGTPLPQETIAELVRLETALFNANHAARAKEKAFLEGEIETTQAQLATVTQQQEQEREGLAADNAELQRHTEMEQRGITTSSRVSDSRRNLLMSSTRYLQATVQIAQFGRDEAALRRRQQEQDDTRKAALLDELQQAVVRVATLTGQIAAVSDKLRYARATREAGPEATEDTPIVTVIRNDEAGPQRLSADEDMQLMPGDVVEVVLPAAQSGLDRLLQN